MPAPIPPGPPPLFLPPVPPMPPVTDEMLLFARVLLVEDWRYIPAPVPPMPPEP